MIYTFGDVSGAHLNPAVTVAFAPPGGFSWREVPGYLGAQIVGALAASGVYEYYFRRMRCSGRRFPPARGARVSSWR